MPPRWMEQMVLAGKQLVPLTLFFLQYASLIHAGIETILVEDASSTGIRSIPVTANQTFAVCALNVGCCTQETLTAYVWMVD